MITILFVCSGNTCRSIMASAILKEKIEKQNIKNLSCFSAGVFAKSGEQTNKNAIIALNHLEIYLTSKQSTQLTEKLIDQSSLVLVMTEDLKRIILNRYKTKQHIFSVAEYLKTEDILDPYNLGEKAYIDCALSLVSVVDKLLIKLKEEKWL